jgi:hypothetical protein
MGKYLLEFSVGTSPVVGQGHEFPIPMVAEQFNRLPVLAVFMPLFLMKQPNGSAA